MVEKCYLIERPYVVSFSGGRTSGFMLKKIIEAEGGRLPQGQVEILFCNTGREKIQTLDFVEECSQRWGVDIKWLEYCPDLSKPLLKYRGGKVEIGCHGYRQVDYKTASRKGEPFEKLIDVMARYRKEAKGADPLLPNPVQRFCTGEMKRRTVERYVKAECGWECYTTVVGLRADEPKRVKRLQETGTLKKYYECPMHDAGHTIEDVGRFWEDQEFDLGLVSDMALGTYQGNCDLCFLKSRAKINKLIAEDPDAAQWWADQEERTGQTFRRDRPSYSELLKTRIPLEQCDDDQDTCHCTD